VGFAALARRAAAAVRDLTEDHGVAVAVGVGSWAVFVVDLVVQRRIVPDYLHRRDGRIDVAILVLTFPYYVTPGVASSSAVLVVARLARVVRLLLATAGLRRFVARLGKVALVAGAVVIIASLAAYQDPTNPGFATVGDALWWDRHPHHRGIRRHRSPHDRWTCRRGVDHVHGHQRARRFAVRALRAPRSARPCAHPGCDAHRADRETDP
jgi:hypothetical protein